MTTTSAASPQLSSFSNQIHHDDCIEVMRQMPTNSVDFILTDPPYLVNYRDRTGTTAQAQGGKLGDDSGTHDRSQHC